MKSRGDSLKDIFLYWTPELVSQTFIVGLPFLLDAYFVSQLHSISTFGALGMANNLLHTLIKLSESIQVATMAVIGKWNGAKLYEKAGRSLGDVFWTSILTGGITALFIFFFSTEIYLWLNVPSHMASIGSPFLKLRAIGVFLMFLTFALIGFMKGVKNTRTPMVIIVISQLIFVFLDYCLILGRFGFPKMRLKGSAIATITQYSFMVTMCLLYIITNKEYKKFFPHAFFYFFSIKGALNILNLSWQIAIDKMSLSLAYVQFSKMIAPMGKYAIATFTVIKDLERFAFLPAIAFASILTFLVSNRLGAKDVDGARANIKKVLFSAGIFVALILLIICFNPTFFIKIFDFKGKFTPLAARIFPVISILVIFDFVQVILAAALRGAGDVRAVMLIRAFTCFCIFTPIGWMIASLTTQNIVTKIILLYGCFYISTGIMGLLFFLRLKINKWHEKLPKTA